jgi:peroxiredoxin
MRTLFSTFLLLSLVSCGDPATASSATASADQAPGATASANSSVPANLDGRKLESPDIRITVPRVPLEGALLIGQLADQQYRVMEAVVEGESVLFRRDEPLKPGHFYAYFSDGTSVQLILDQDQTLTLSTTKEDPVGDAVVKGNLDTELLYDVMRFEAGQQEDFRRLGDAIRSAPPASPAYVALEAEREALIEARDAYQDQAFAKAPGSLFTSFKRAGRNPKLRDVRLPNGEIDEPGQVTAFRQDFWNEVDFNDPRLLNTPVIFNKLKRFMIELTPQNATAIIASADELTQRTLDHPEFFKFVANWITLKYEPGKTTVMDGAAIHVHMIQNYFTRERAFWSDSMTVYGLQQRADQMAHSLVGQPGPDITVPGIDGKPKRLYDLKKPYIAVFMYNPECDHCIEETPQLVRAYQSMKNELDVYAIALDTEDDKWKNFVRNNGMDVFTNVYDPTNRSIFKTYYVDNTPELYLLGPDRKIISKNIKVSQLAEALRLAKSK